MVDTFLKNANQSFLQSAAWEKFQQGIGRRTWRVNGNLVIRHDLFAGFNYLYAPRPEVFDGFLPRVTEIAKSNKAIFLKIDPARQFSIFNFQFSISESIQPKKTAILDLTKSEEELLSAMHEKTRYNIRLAARKGVEVSSGGDFEMFWNLLRETAERDKFGIHPREHYEKLLSVRDNDFFSEIFFAQYDGKAVAAILVNFYKPSQAVTYLHGASSREYREIMAPYLLHWRIIQEAKTHGFKYYDFWGIDEARWPGLTRFKLGFGGERIEYPPSVDVVYRPALYALYRCVKFLRH